MENKEYLRKLVFFSELDDKSLNEISRLIVERKYKKNEIIFMEGEPSEAVFFIKKGKVKISKNAPDGKEHIIHIMGNGDVFAEACLFGDVPYPASAEAVDDTDIIMIKNKEFLELLETIPQVAIEIIRVMSGRLIMVSRQIENLALKDAYGKAASLIMQMLRSQGNAIKNGEVLITNLSRQEMANMVGLTRETFTRALSKLKQDGAIEIDRENIKIVDADKLKNWMG